jgi:hypothetical protein
VNWRVTATFDWINRYLDAADHGPLPSAPLSKQIRNNRRATAATNALDQGTDIAKLQERLGDAKVSKRHV